MSAISICRPEILGFVHNGNRNNLKFQRGFASMSMTSKSCLTMKKAEVSIKLSTPLVLPQTKPSTPNELRFDRSQPSELDLVDKRRLEFDQFVAREAVVDEELWTAAWLRAETNWENRPNERHGDSLKRKFAEQEFNAIKKRYSGQNGQTGACIVTVRKEQKNVKRSVIKSVVATLDVNYRHLMQGETFPGEKKSQLCRINKEIPKYAYIANVCVSKSARRQGIASNMLTFAVETARSSGIEQVYMHVHRSNTSAQALYKKMGFEVTSTSGYKAPSSLLRAVSLRGAHTHYNFQVVEKASSQLLEEQTYLLCLNTEV